MYVVILTLVYKYIGHRPVGRPRTRWTISVRVAQSGPMGP